MILHDVLDKFRKDQLLDIGDVLGFELSPRMKRASMVTELSGYIHKEPGRWLSHLSERDIHLLRDLVKAGPERVRYHDYAPYPSVVEITGIVQSDNTEQKYSKLWITREVFDIISPEIESAINKAECLGQYELEKVALGYLNLYGMLPTHTLMDLLFAWPMSTKVESKEKPILNFIEHSPIVSLCRFEDRWGDNMVSPCIENEDEMFSLREGFKAPSRQKKFSSAQVLEAGSGAPFFSVAMDTPEGIALESVYRRVGYKGLDLKRAIFDTWVESQYTAMSNPALFDPLYDAPNASSIPDPVWEELCMAVCDYADSVPKWCLHGRSAREANQCFCDRQAWAEPEAFQEPETADYPRWRMPEPTVSKGYGAETSDFSIGLAIPHVAPDDPCPCGSGLRYCRCHGKYLS